MKRPLQYDAKWLNSFSYCVEVTFINDAGVETTHSTCSYSKRRARRLMKRALKAFDVASPL